MGKRFSNIVGFDDAPFDRDARGDVTIVGTVYAGLRFDGVLMAEVEKDGFNAASKIIECIEKSRFPEHIRLIMLGGITFAGFNVIDVFELYERLCTPVLVVARKAPDMDAICRALTGGHIPQGMAKWKLIRRLGSMMPVRNVFVQTIGLSVEQAGATIEQFSIHGNMPEPLRTAHLIAGAFSCGHSRGRP